MIWIAPSEKDTNPAGLEKRLWDAADKVGVNSGLQSNNYGVPAIRRLVFPFAARSISTHVGATWNSGNPPSRRPSCSGEPGLSNGWVGILHDAVGSRRFVLPFGRRRPA